MQLSAVRFMFWALILAIELDQALGACSGYFCDKHLDTIVILQTHNSLATPGKVLSPNQNKNLKTQFRDGIRGFNLDLYDKDGELFTKHGDTWGYNPSDVIKDLVSELNKGSNRNEFVIIQLQDEMKDSKVVNAFLNLFGSLLIINFDSRKQLAYYIEQNKRVLVLTSSSSNVDTGKGMHYSPRFIIENDYEWRGCYFDGPPMGERYPNEKKARRPAVLMNHFCSLIGAGNIIASEAVNRYHRILFNARELMKQEYAKKRVNIIHIDYYEHGSPFTAQEALRDGDPDKDCWSDGTLCGLSTTCWKCCNTQHYWWSKAFTACGKPACWSDGKICAAGTTCKACCNGHSYWAGKVFTACGKEPCWRDVRCLAGTTCKQCCDGNEWKWSKFGHFCK